MTNARARRARAIRYGDTEAAEVALDDLRAANLEEHIRKVVDAAPPLSETQRARLAALLVPVDRGAAT